MRYVQARSKEDVLEKTYRIYVTDCLKLIAENTARYASGTTIGVRYADLIEDKPEETRTSDEVISDIRDKIQKLEG